MKLTPAVQRFVVRWGEMGSTWGVNRATAQIIALLYLAQEPLTAEEISTSLSLARSTVSTDLRELQNWGLVRVAHVLGDRRDHFETLGDPGELLRTILTERKRRELDPLVAALREGVAEAGEGEAFVRDRMRSMLEVFEVATALYERTAEIPTDRLFTMGRQAGQLPLATTLKLAQLGERFGESLKRLVR